MSRVGELADHHHGFAQLPALLKGRMGTLDVLERVLLGDRYVERAVERAAKMSLARR